MKRIGVTIALLALTACGSDADEGGLVGLVSDAADPTDDVQSPATDAPADDIDAAAPPVDHGPTPPPDCSANPQQCDDGQPCTTDSCGADGLCKYVPVANGTVCGGQMACTDGLCESDGMLLVSEGRFTMGCSPASHPGCKPDEQPEHGVTLADYAVDRTEVTAGQYEACVAAGGCTVPLNSVGQCTYGSGGDFPITCVDWFQARAYCSWADKRLCTEAEWEKAARGVDGRPYPWGDEPPTCERVIWEPNESGCGTGAAWPVGSKPAGAAASGAVDMAGNVWEWVGDWYDADYYKNSPDSDPQGPQEGVQRSVRGGSFGTSGVAFLRVDARGYFAPESGDDDLGFRCCKSLP